MSAAYVIWPKADLDLEEHSFYLACEVNPELGHRFLVAAHETFALLAGYLRIGWQPRLKNPQLASVRVFRISGFEKCLFCIGPPATESRSFACCTARETF